MSGPSARALRLGRDRPHILIAALALILFAATVVAGVSLPMLFVGTLVLAAALAAVIRPEIGLHVLVLNALMGLVRLVEMPRLGPLSVPVLLEALLVAAVLFQMALLGRRPRLGTPAHGLMALLGAWIFLSVLTGVTVGPENFDAFRNLFLVRFVVFLLVTVLVTTIAGVRRMLVTFVIGNAGLVVLATAARLGWFGQEKITVSQSFERTGALLQNPNELAFNLTTMLVITLTSFLLARRMVWKALLLGLAAADLAVILSTLSRSGFISLCAVLLFLFFKVTRNLRVLLLLLALVACGWLLMPDELFARFSQVDEIRDVDRLHLARVGLAMALDHPLTGVGLDNYVPLFWRYNVANLKAATAAHNMYVDLAAQMGFPALVLYLAAFGLTWRGLRRQEADLKAARRTRSFEYLVGLAVQASFVNLAVFGLSGDVQFDYAALILLGLALPLLREHAKERGAA